MCGQIIDSWVVSKTNAALINERKGKGGVPHAASNFPWPSDHSAVMTLALVRPVDAPSLINVKRRRVVRPKEVVTVGVTVPDGESWTVVIVPADRDPLSADVVTGMFNEPIIYRRTVRFGTHMLTAREYDAVLLSVGEAPAEVARVRFAVIEENTPTQVFATPTVNMSQNVGGENDWITFSWRDSPGNRHDFLAIYKDSTVDVNDYCGLIFTGGHFGGELTVQLGNKKLFHRPMEAGFYKVMFMNNDEFLELARASFRLAVA